jgi:DAK2 domain fusion protein YloV
MEPIKKINGEIFKKLIINGCQNLFANKDEVDDLNVFPVPDGDTGSNMHMTINGGAKAINDSNELSIGLIAKQASRSMTLSARGNSGVILSQFFKGVSLELEGKDEVDVKGFSKAIIHGYQHAYTVVKKPVEGTILTVMRESATAADNALTSESSLQDYFKVLITEARESTKRTPELLEVLKEANVVDSGAQGYVYIIEGMAKALDGQILEYVNSSTNGTSLPSVDHPDFNADTRLEFGYCTEFILQLMNYKVDVKNFDLDIINKFLEANGNSIVSFKDDDVVKVHVHTFTPGVILNEMQKYGEFVTVKVENMSVQNYDLKDDRKVVGNAKPKKHQKYAIVAVSSGEGISEVFTQYGADVIVSGGQTMNPSTESFIKAFDSLDADNIFVFPNNSNIIMAAKQAAENYNKSKIYVINSKTIAECYTALAMLDYSADDPTAIADYFEEQISYVVSGQVTYSIRDSKINGVEIKKGDYIGILNKDIVTSQKTKVDALMEMLKADEDIEDRETLVIMFGKDVTDEEKKEALDRISSTYPQMEVGSFDGKQDVYSFIIAL